MHFFIKQASIINRVFELRENPKGELFLNFPKQRMGCIPRDIIQDLPTGSEIQVDTTSLEGKISHFSAHSSGQRHVKTTKKSFAIEKVIGCSITKIDTLIPLATLVASIHDDKHEEQTDKDWMGFNLLPDTNYLIMDIFALPKDAVVQIQLHHKITNLKKSRETFDLIPIEMKNCNVVVAIRSSDYSLAEPSVDVVFVQAAGKGLTVTRVEGYMIDTQVVELEVGNLKWLRTSSTSPCKIPAY